MATAQTDARSLARDAAAKYFEALAGRVPSDDAPVNLIEECIAIQDALLAERPARDHEDEDREDAALHAGYLLGLEVGLRMRGQS